MVAIKICGVRTPQVANACDEMGIEFIGLNFVPTSKRVVNIQTAQNIRGELSSTRAVGIFRDMDVDSIYRTIDTVQLDYVQLHGTESPDICAQLRGRGVGMIKALPISTDIHKQMLSYHGSVDILLIDAPVAGSGVQWDWQMLTVRDTGDYQLFIAGGLTPATVAQAIQIVAPDGVDVASGVESAGEIDIERIRAFHSSVHNSVHNSTRALP